jgi:hypothetical protein
LLANELLEYIYQNEKVIFVLEGIGCHHITSHSLQEYRCGLPNHTNKTSVCVKKSETLKITIYSEEETIRGNLYTLIMYIKKYTFIEALKYLHKELNVEYTGYNTKQIEKKETPLDIFLKVKPKKKNKIDVKDIQFIDYIDMNDYLPYLHINWYKEGILPITRKIFNIRFDEKSNRIVIPHYNPWYPDNIMGIMGRTVLPSEYCELLDVPKYYPLKKFPKSLSLYGYTQNYQNIISSGFVYVLESEKSVLKLHSRQIKNAVAIGSHSLSEEQIKLLIGLDVEIVICYDQDIKLEHILNECKRFNNIRNCSYMFDEWDMLNLKESPADKHLKIFKFMSKHRIKYNEKEHLKYLKGVVK